MSRGWAHGPSRGAPPLDHDGAVSPPDRPSLCAHREAGVTSLEFVGIVLVVGAVVAAIALALNGQRVTAETASALCSITGGSGCGATGGDATAGDATGSTGPGDGPVTAPCVGAPRGAAGPVRGVVPVRGGGTDGPGLRVAVMGDGTFRVSGAASERAADTTWVGRTFGPAAAGAEPFLTGGDPRVWAASSPAALAELVAASRTSAWSDSLVGDDGSVVSQVADAAMGLVGGPRGLPTPTAVYTDTSAEVGLSLNAYEQTLALDAGGEAVGTLRQADGSTTQYVGVSETPTQGVARADDLVPMLLEVDRGPSGEVTSVRIVTDHDLTATGTTTRSGSLHVVHLGVTGADEPVIAALASSLGSSDLGTLASSPSGAPVPLSQSAAGFTRAATAGGYVTRQEPAGEVVVDDPNAPPLTAGLAQVMRSAAPQSWDGATWRPRSVGCAS